MKLLSDDFYRAVDPDVLERAARRGTAIHNAVENFAKFGIEDIPPAYAGYFQAFREWWELRQPEVLATEWRWSISRSSIFTPWLSNARSYPSS